MRWYRELRRSCHSRCIYFACRSWNRNAWLGRIMCWSKLELPSIPFYPSMLTLGYRWRRCLAGPYRGRGAAGIGNVAVRMYARSGLDDKPLADWSHTSGQGISGGRRFISSGRSLTSKVNGRVFSCAKNDASKSIELWHKHFMKMRRKVAVRRFCN